MSSDKTILIVGGGLAGSIPAKAFSNRGWNVTVFDRCEQFGASRSSENIFSVTWADTLGSAVANSGIRLLNEHFPVETIRFWTGKRFNPCLQIPFRKILWPRITPANVTEVGDGYLIADGIRHEGIVLVATGAWANELVQIPKVGALTGHGLLFNGTCEKPLMDFWAPYRHQKIFQWDEGRIWYGDSTCILDKNYRRETMVAASIERAASVGLTNPVEILFGKRPFMLEGNKKGFFKRLAKNLFVSTSGWKCGMVIYAHQTRLLMKELLGDA